MPFQPGQSGNPAGKPKGATNLATREVKEWAEKFFASKKWRTSAESRMLKGKAPHLEGYLLALTYGKPVERVEHSGDEGGPIKLMFGGRYKPDAAA
jgi:hypothetical protein